MVYEHYVHPGSDESGSAGKLHISHLIDPAAAVTHSHIQRYAFARYDVLLDECVAHSQHRHRRVVVLLAEMSQYHLPHLVFHFYKRADTFPCRYI